MLKRFLIPLLICLLSVSAVAQKIETKTVEQITDVNFCDLFTNPNDYSNKLVRVKTSHQVAFEVSKLYCLDCLDLNRSWLSFGKNFDEKTKKDYRKILKKTGTFNVALVGRFYTGKTYGYQNLYESEFVAEYAEYAELLSSKKGEMTIAAKAKTYCQKND